MLYMDSPAHADDAATLGLLIQRLEVELSAIFIFLFGCCCVKTKEKGGLMGFSSLHYHNDVIYANQWLLIHSLCSTEGRLAYLSNSLQISNLFQPPTGTTTTSTSGIPIVSSLSPSWTRWDTTPRPRTNSPTGSCGWGRM